MFYKLRCSCGHRGTSIISPVGDMTGSLTLHSEHDDNINEQADIS